MIMENEKKVMNEKEINMLELNTIHNLIKRNQGCDLKLSTDGAKQGIPKSSLNNTIYAIVEEYYKNK